MPDDRELVNAAIAALHALRSYQYAGGSPGLAEEAADALETALKRTMELDVVNNAST